MRVSTVREFRDRATGLLRSKDPILVTRRGKLAGVFLPLKDSSLPLDLRRELFSLLSSEIARQLRKAGASERAVLSDFTNWRKSRRETRRRR
jgi:PHD/YefM family antitoxin component YafN of YafNO toxin-antitoxin module